MRKLGMLAVLLSLFLGLATASTLQQSTIYLSKEYGVTREKLNEAVGTFINKVPEIARVQSQLQSHGLSLAVYGGTSREVIQAVAEGIKKRGGYETYMKWLQSQERISFLDWHRLASDIDLMVIGQLPSGVTTREINDLIHSHFPESIFYKRVDLNFPGEFFGKFDPRKEHFEAVSNIAISSRGFESEPLKSFLTIDPKDNLLKNPIRGNGAIHLSEWGIEQFLEGKFDFRINEKALRIKDSERDLIQVARWIRIISEMNWMPVGQYMDPASQNNPISRLVESSRGQRPNQKLTKIIETIEKSQIYSGNSELSRDLLRLYGIDQLDWIPKEKIFTPLPYRSPTQEERAKDPALPRLGDKHPVVYHRTNLSAAQGISRGAVFSSDGKSSFSSKTSMAAHGSGLYTSDLTGSLSYGDHYAAIHMNPNAILGIDYSEGPAGLILHTRSAIQTSDSGALKIEPINRASILQSSKSTLESKTVSLEHRQSLIRSVAALLNPGDSETDLNYLDFIFRNSNEHKMTDSLVPFFARKDIIKYFLGTPTSSQLQQAAYNNLRASFFSLVESAAPDFKYEVFRSLITEPQLRSDPSIGNLYQNLVSRINREPAFAIQIASDSEILRHLWIHHRDQWREIAWRSPGTVAFDLQNPEMQVEIRRILLSGLPDQHYNEMLRSFLENRSIKSQLNGTTGGSTSSKPSFFNWINGAEKQKGQPKSGSDFFKSMFEELDPQRKLLWLGETSDSMGFSEFHLWNMDIRRLLHPLFASKLKADRPIVDASFSLVAPKYLKIKDWNLLKQVDASLHTPLDLKFISPGHQMEIVRRLYMEDPNLFPREKWIEMTKSILLTALDDIQNGKLPTHDVVRGIHHDLLPQLSRAQQKILSKAIDPDKKMGEMKNFQFDETRFAIGWILGAQNDMDPEILNLAEKHGSIFYRMYHPILKKIRDQKAIGSCPQLLSRIAEPHGS